MKDKTDNRHGRVDKHGLLRLPRDIRAALRELCRDDHYLFPRQYHLSYGIDHYINAKKMARPLVVAKSMAMIAENCLYLVKHHPEKCSLEVTKKIHSFYAHTRRVIRNLLNVVPANNRTDKERTKACGKMVLPLVSEVAFVRPLIFRDIREFIRVGLYPDEVAGLLTLVQRYPEVFDNPNDLIRKLGG